MNGSGSYRAAREGAVVVRRDDRTLLRAYGRDPLRMLQGLLTNDLAGAPADRAVPSALLTPKGRMVAEVRAWRGGDDVLIETARAALPALLDYFRKYVPPLFARFETVPDVRVLGVYGPRTDSLLASIGAPADAPEYAVVVADERSLLRTRYTGDDGWDVIAAEEALSSLEQSCIDAGAVRGDAATLDVLRIEAGRPAWGAELTDAVIPLEAGLEGWISTSKGCYTGQEVIIRILHRGHVNRHLRGFLLGDAAPPAGTEIVHPETDKPVGVLTSVCDSPRLRQTIALGYARRELEPPVEVRLAGGGEAVVVALPFPSTDVGQPSPPPGS